MDSLINEETIMAGKIKQISSLLKLGVGGMDINDAEFLTVLWKEIQTGQLNEYEFMAIIQRALDDTFSYGMDLESELSSVFGGNVAA